jgi:hypothetical protein
MVEKMLLEYDKLHKQRALLMSAVLNLMVKNFEGEDANIFKIALGKQIIDVMVKDDGDIMLNDEVEQIVFKSIASFLEKETALLNIKQLLKGDQPL